MPKTNIRRRRDSSSSSSTNEDSKPETIEKIEEIKYLQKLRQRSHGVDVYSLAIGETDTSSTQAHKTVENDPWKSRTGGLVDMRIIKEKRGNEIVKNMHSNFAKETNQRDEDAEMQKFIEEQLRLKKEADKLNQDPNSAESLIDQNIIVKKYKTPEDALFDVPKYLIESNTKNKSEETLSEQMLSGIPEVDLGVDERIRNIEDTERAKQKLAVTKSTQSSSSSSNHNRKINDASSVNFVQHKRFDESLINADKNRMPSHAHNKPVKQDPVVGDAPKHELLQQATQKRKQNELDAASAAARPHAVKKHRHRTTNSANGKVGADGVERASDDYCLERFKKNMRFSRSTKIKIA